MNGLKYALFVKGLSLKEVAAELKIVPQSMTYWVNGTRPIPSDQLHRLAQFLKVEATLLTKEVLLEDKIKIEVQLNLPGVQSYETLETLDLYHRHEQLKRRYKELLGFMNQTDRENKELKARLAQIETICQRR